LAAFWSEALHRKVDDGVRQDFASIAPIDKADAGPVLMFVKVPEAKSAKNGIHFDLKTTQVDSETTRLITLGATELRPSVPTPASGSASPTPKGNEFDIVVV
jgi:hypothetical protein